MLTTLAILLAGTTVRAARPTTVYLFGITQCLNDTVVYLSGMQQLDGVALSKDGLLVDRAYFSACFDSYVDQAFSRQNTVTSVMYSKSRKKAEKLYVKARSRALKNKGVRLQEVPTTSFQFKLRSSDNTK